MARTMPREPPPDHTRSPGPPLIAGRYRPEARLGKGGAAEVFRVTDVERGRSLALKQLRSDASEQLKALFELEFQTLATLRHPRAVQVFDYGIDGGSSFYTMELLAGEDLKERAPVDYRQACAYLRDAALVLSVLHARRLVHRDVSPRNLWCTPDGRVKLIDFGAVVPFGARRPAMGTPPFMSPEAQAEQPLDARSDLYSLGAVAYYLLTGTHAFPARTLRELPSLWERAPLAPSVLVAEAERTDLPPIPPELDAVVLSLLQRDPLARPSSAAELIDRLDVLLGSSDRVHGEAAAAVLPEPAFVGRRREMRRLRRQLALAASGRGQCAVLDGEPGFGRSRLLSELALTARVVPAVVLMADGALDGRPFGTAAGLALCLLDALPERARELAGTSAALLARLSPEVAERLRVSPSASEALGTQRTSLHTASLEWLLRVGAEHPLVILVDDLDQADEASAALLLALARARTRARIFVVATLPSRTAREAHALRSLRGLAHEVRLAPLAGAETAALMSSMFGDAEHLGRLAEAVQRKTGGDPSYVLELCREMVRRGAITQANGSWVLPRALPPELLDATLAHTRADRLARLGPAARELGRLLSIPSGVVPLELARSLGESGPDALFLHLDELVQAGVAAYTPLGVRFTHEDLRALLGRELAPELAARARTVVAAHLLARPDAGTLERLEAGVLLLESDDPRGAEIVAAASVHVSLSEGEQLARALPYLERALALLRAKGYSRRELASLLASLARAGYYVDASYEERYGEEALAGLGEIVGLPRAARLSPLIGRKLGLIVALVVSALGARLGRKHATVPSFREAIALLFSTAMTLIGSSAASIDPARAARYAGVLDPFSVFGTRNVAGITHAMAHAIVDTVTEKQGTTHRRWRALLERLESSAPIPGMLPSVRRRCVAGALYALGLLEAQRDGTDALRTVERLEVLDDPHARLTAHQVRTLYYAHQGARKQYEEAREQLDQHAIEQGATFQVETWLAAASVAFQQRQHDAMGIKRTAEQLQQLAPRLPSLEPHAREARGFYLLARGRPRSAIPLLEHCLEAAPTSRIAQSRVHANLARAYRMLGDPERAHATCQRALAPLGADDLVFHGFHLALRTELMLAEAALGQGACALARCEELIAGASATAGALTMGELHEAALRLALAAGDRHRALAHLSDAVHWYRSTGFGSLAQHCEELTRELRGTAAPREPAPLAPHDATFTDGGRTAVDRLLGGGTMPLDERAHRALRVLAGSVDCARGFLFLLDVSGTPRLAASLNEEPPSTTLLWWVEGVVQEALAEAETVVDAETDESLTAASQTSLSEGTERYTATLLPSTRADGPAVIGVVVLVSEASAPERCEARLAQIVGYHLERALALRGTHDTDAVG